MSKRKPVTEIKERKPGALTLCPACGPRAQWQPTGITSRQCRGCALVQTVDDLYPELAMAERFGEGGGA